MSDISLYLDEDVRPLLAEVLRNRGYNATHALEINRTGKSDEEQLAYAVKHKMVILTHNIRDFRILFDSYADQKKSHYGISVSDQLPFNDLLRRSLRFLSSATRDSIINRLIWLQDYK